MRLINILILLTLTLAIVYFTLDRQLSYYGKSDLDIYNILPQKINPEFWGYDIGYRGFVLEDAHGFAVVAKENKFEVDNKTFEVNEVLRYGFDSSKVIAVVNDTKDKKYFIELAEDRDNPLGQDMMINVLDEANGFNTESYKWVEIQGNKKHIRRIELFRNYTIIVVFAIVLGIGYQVLRRIKLSQ